MITPARNPMRINGCEFIELASPSSGVLIPAFKGLGPISMSPLTDED